MNLLPSGATERTLEMLFTVRERSIVEDATSKTKTARVVPFGMFTPKMYRPSLDSCRPPADPNAPPVPAPPALNGEPGIGVSEPSAWRLKPSMVFWPVVFPLT